MNLFKNSVLGVGVVEELAYGTALALFAAVCVALPPERAARAASPFEFYRAVDRVCVQVLRDGDAEDRFWPDSQGDVAVERRKWEHFVAKKVDGAKEVFKGATGVRTMHAAAASAREDFLATVRHYVEATERFQRDGARSAALFSTSKTARAALRDLSWEQGARVCVIVI
ncbi:hypothetical protein ACFQ05_00400 [Amycolatopsis umgeniensis]|uniref:Uncharacterized protein n=1 Tax=Amycolatopsis umgeniensis TaxID=336628 RepID=A0A841AXW0_9PSEU|nr:hypothetical protein [Amycolatopsis umgeniensis]MBB5851713.1 hypothetical protein [Amycolatopsis umgeniensis]